jgi:hypothetical protein
VAREASKQLKRQMGVALPDDLKAQLEQTAREAGHSIAEEIRQRLEASFAVTSSVPPRTLELVRTIATLDAVLMRATGRKWHEHPAAFSVFEQAIALHFERLKTSLPLAGEPVFKPDELPPDSSVIPTGNLEHMAIALEAIVSFQLKPRPSDTAASLNERIITELAKKGVVK